MGFDPAALPEAALAFLAERHLATLTTLGAGGRPHVVAIGFTFDPADGLVRIITDRASQKAANAARYRPPRDNPTRVAVEITVERVLGRV
jgi:predicted pyridoxine 5'-phosphate oxidase superfamily flavin-nucleotide-binding protein